MKLESYRIEDVIKETSLKYEFNDLSSSEKRIYIGLSFNWDEVAKDIKKFIVALRAFIIKHEHSNEGKKRLILHLEELENLYR